MTSKLIRPIADRLYDDFKKREENQKQKILEAEKEQLAEKKMSHSAIQGKKSERPKSEASKPALYQYYRELQLTMEGDIIRQAKEVAANLSAGGFGEHIQTEVKQKVGEDRWVTAGVD